MTESLKAKPSQRAARLAAKGLRVSECNFYLLARSCGTGRAGGLRNADANLNYMHRALRTVRSHWKLAAQRIAPISVQAAPRDRRISWPICFVVGFLGHTQTRAHSGEDKDEDRGSNNYSGDQRDPQAAESPTATFALLCCPHTALYRECASVCVWVSEYLGGHHSVIMQLANIWQRVRIVIVV